MIATHKASQTISGKTPGINGGENGNQSVDGTKTQNRTRGARARSRADRIGRAGQPALLKDGAAGDLYYSDFVTGTGTFTVGNSTCGPYTEPLGYYSASLRREVRAWNRRMRSSLAGRTSALSVSANDAPQANSSPTARSALRILDLARCRRVLVAATVIPSLAAVSRTDRPAMLYRLKTSLYRFGNAESATSRALRTSARNTSSSGPRARSTRSRRASVDSGPCSLVIRGLHAGFRKCRRH